VTQGASVTLRDNTIRDNTVTGSAGGVRITAASIEVTGNTVTGNSAHDAGGLQLSGPAAIVRNTIAGNRASYRYGGLTVTSSAAVLDSNTIHDNDGGEGYGAAYLAAGTHLVRNNLITGNRAGYYPGLMVSGAGLSRVVNNTLVDNIARTSSSPFALYVSSGTPLVANNVVAFNTVGILVSQTAKVRNNCSFGNTLSNWVRPDSAGADGNIELDPQFADRASGDFRLAEGSPCRDTGDDSAIQPDDLDLDGSPRIQGRHVDMGAYETADATGIRWWDVLRALRLTGGIEHGTPDDMIRLDTGADALLDMLDCVRLARKAAGLDPNP